MTHKGLTQTAYEIIKERLLNGEIKPGERIREDIIAEEISISRTPVRESINRLAAEGFVIQIPRKGIFASKLSLEEMIDIVEIRVIIESYAARKCCKNITESQIGELEEICNQYSESLRKADFVSSGIYDGIFHRKLGEFSGNKFIKKYVNEIEDLAVFARRMEEFCIDEGYIEEMSVEHKDIVQAIKNRNEEEAAKTVEKNTKQMLRRLQQ